MLKNQALRSSLRARPRQVLASARAAGADAVNRLRPVPPLPDHPFSAADARAVKDAIRTVAGEVATMPDAFTRDVNGPMQDVVLVDDFEDTTYGFIVFGPEGEEKGQAIDRLRGELKDRGVDANVMEVGRPIGINPAEAKKSNALLHYVKRSRVPIDEILKFGDRAAANGNDRPLLLGKNAFNVGEQPAADPNVVNLATHGPAGVAAVLRARREAGEKVRAVASDLDGTLNGGSTQRGWSLDPAAAAELVAMIRAGGKFALITGRGESAINLVIPPLREAGLKESELSSVTLYLFNGGKGLTLG